TASGVKRWNDQTSSSQQVAPLADVENLLITLALQHHLCHAAAGSAGAAKHHGHRCGNFLELAAQFLQRNVDRPGGVPAREFCCRSNVDQKRTLLPERGQHGHHPSCVPPFVSKPEHQNHEWPILTGEFCDIHTTPCENEPVLWRCHRLTLHPGVSLKLSRPVIFDDGLVCAFEAAKGTAFGAIRSAGSKWARCCGTLGSMKHFLTSLVLAGMALNVSAQTMWRDAPM